MKTKNMTTSPMSGPSPLRRSFLLIPLVLATFALSPMARAACREGCNDTNTYLGDDALLNNTTGTGNVAIGLQALFENTTGFGNTASGFTALHDNTIGGENTAAGDGALFSNTTGSSNTANGANALLFNISGDNNTASGEGAMQNYITGSNNTANGFEALFGDSRDRSTGSFNTANGVQALFSNTTGGSNTASGYLALFGNTTGSFNVANGANALQSNTTAGGNVANGGFALFSNTTGTNNVAEGFDALIDNTTGSNNIAVGPGAGGNLTTGHNNIDIGFVGVAGEGNTIRIGTQGTQTKTFVAGINGVAIRGVAVKVAADGQLGTAPSSARFKQNIKPMDQASEAIHALKPVTFHYKKEIDPGGTSQFGLVAEEVEKVNPDLVVRDNEGKPYSVCYEAVNAMLLNEFLKEHRKNEEQEATIAQLKRDSAEQQRQIETLTTGLQRVSNNLAAASPSRGGLELNRSAPQIAVNKQ
jgi:trimeric autotransporter adhesin